MVAAISVSIIGMLLGPMFPIALNHTPRVLPRHLVNGTVGWIFACTAGGNALLSFIVGEMVSKLGIESLQPLCVCYPTPLLS
jgi:fucose permease